MYPLSEGRVLYTFDVFDTIITRCVARPDGVFAIMHSRLLSPEYSDIPAFVRNNFFMLRKNAESVAYTSQLWKQELANEYPGEVTFGRIYDCLCSVNGLSDGQKQRLSELEKELELLCGVGINENIERIRSLLDAGERVAFISDMYYDRGFIKLLICKHAPDFKDVPLYVSCEEGCGKASGALFRRVAKGEGFAVESIVHYGDNWAADVLGARKAGSNSERYQFPELKPYEKEALGKFGDDAVSQIVSGVSRNTRLSMKSGVSGEMGCSFAGAVLFPYLWHVLQRSRDLGIEKLFFIARDGYILKIIADKILSMPVGAKFLPIETRYIYSSRKVWLTSDSEVRELAQEYLRQEILGDSETPAPFAFVDLQGTGRTMSCAAQMIREITDYCFTCFFFSSPTSGELGGYRHETFGINETQLFEQLCRAPHGKTIGYEKAGYRIVPVLDDIAPQFEEFDFDEYAEAIAEYSANLCNAVRATGIELDRVKITASYKRYALTEQENEVLSFYGKMLHDADINWSEEVYGHPFAIRPTKKELRNMFLLRPINSDYRDYCSSSFPKLALLLCDAEDRRRIEFFKRHYSGVFGKIARFSCRKPTIVYRDRVFEICNSILSHGCKNIVIHGFGKIGSRLSSRLSNKKIDLLITDKNYQNRKGASEPRDILAFDYDVVIIAIEDAAACKDAKEELVEIGVLPEKIITYIPTGDE